MFFSSPPLSTSPLTPIVSLHIPPFAFPLPTAAYFVTTRVFWAYHGLVARKCEPAFTRLVGGDPLRRVWWIKYFDFVEDRNVLPIENQFVWNVEKDAADHNNNNSSSSSNNGDVRKML